MLKVRDIQRIHRQDLSIDNTPLIASIRQDILAGDVVIVKSVLEKKLIESIKNYLIQIGQNSLPNYQAIYEDMIYIEDECEIGDVVFFNAQIPHGVTIIDEIKKPN